MRFRFLVLLFAGAVGAAADSRDFVWTYQYGSVPQGAAEVEFYSTIVPADLNRYEYRLEIEHGITSRFDGALYQIFTQVEGGGLVWDAMQVRFRYRFAEKGEKPVNSQLYLEYARGLRADDPSKIELKGIFDRSGRVLTVAVNPLYEIAFGNGEKPEHEAGAHLGLSARASCGLSAGMEVSGIVEFEPQDEGYEREVKGYAGPTLAYRKGIFQFAGGLASGLTEDSDRMRLRFILGILIK